MASKNGAEGRDRSHENRDTAFHGLPEDFPHQVDTGRTVNPTYAYECDYGHEEGEAEERAQGKLLPCPDFGSSKDDDGDADDLSEILAKLSTLEALGKIY